MVAVWRTHPDNVPLYDRATGVKMDIQRIVAAQMVERVVEELHASRELGIKLIAVAAAIGRWYRSATGACSRPVMVNVGILYHYSNAVGAGARIRLKRDSLRISVPAFDAIDCDPFEAGIDRVDAIVPAANRACLSAVDNWEAAGTVVADCNWQAATAIHIGNIQLFMPHTASLEQNAISRLEFGLDTIHLGNTPPWCA